MQIRSKIILPTIAIFTLLLAQTANAATITGTAYGQQIGFMHSDYTTAVNPCDPAADPVCPATPAYNYDSYHFGLKDEFYISPADLNYSNTGSAFIAKIQNLDECDKANKTCNLTGFLWSDTIGWILLEGAKIKDGFTTDGETKFPVASYAKVNYDGIFSGYAWSEKTGWISLASNPFDPKVPVSALNYGVWIDLKSPPVDPLLNSGCSALNQTKCPGSYICDWNVTESKCVSKEISLGRPLQGYAWSEKLGWIKFSPTAGDETFFGAYTTWLPDITEPVINPLIVDNMWFANDNLSGNIPWANIATDPETGINIDASDIKILPVDNTADFLNCTGYGKDASDILVDKPIPTDPNYKGIDINIGSIGRIQGTLHGFCAYTISGTIVNNAGLTAPKPGDPPFKKTFYVRAGDYVAEKSTFTADTTPAVADGVDFLSYTFTPKDIASNPIVPVKVAKEAIDGDGNPIIQSNPATWVRDVQGIYHFDASNIYFNTLSNSPSNPDSNPAGYLPVKFDDGGISSETPVAGTIYTSSTKPEDILPFTASNFSDIRYPYGDGVPPARPSDFVLGSFYLQVASYAPTSSCGDKCNNENNVALNSLAFTITDKFPTEKSTSLAIGSVSTPLASSIDFTPAVITSTYDISSDVFKPADPGSATFDVENKSSLPIGAVSIDNLMILDDDLGMSALYELIDIYEDSNPDSIASRTDYMNLLPIGERNLKARYEIFRGTPSDSGSNDASATVFHSSTDEKYPFPSSYYYNLFTVALISPQINSQGTYEIFAGLGGEDINGNTLPDITNTIDRSDFIGNNLLVGPNPSTIKINFKISDYLPIPDTSTTPVKLSVDQFIAYRMANLPVTGFNDFAIYEYPDQFPDAEVKRVGVQATGIVTGENIFQTIGGRDFQTITSPGLSNLKKQMRDNAAELSRNISDTTTCSTDDQDISGEELPKEGNCVRQDTHNNTVIAVYGPDGDMLTLGNRGTIKVPANTRYTVIVRGGANVFINANIAYQDENSSFGMIVLAGDDDKGGNVYISPAVTNLVGLLYAEGSLLSSTDGSKLYYVESGGDTNDLKNQLYWQGSIVSKNTIGGAASKTVPEGVNCQEDIGINDPAVCAQVFDLDYIRRFSYRVIKDTDGTPTNNGYVPAPYKFSGGGSCSSQTTCTADGVLPTCVKLTEGLIDISASKSLDPFFIEKDNRPAPLGFTSGAGMERAIEIRQ